MLNPKSPAREPISIHTKRQKSGLLLPGEDRHRLHSTYANLYDYLRPQHPAETFLIDQLVAAIWRFHRYVEFESALITAKAEELYPQLTAEFENLAQSRLLSSAWYKLAEDKATNSLVNRHLTVCRNLFRGALADLEKLRKLKGDPSEPCLPPPTFTGPSCEMALAPIDPDSGSAPTPAPAPAPTEDPFITQLHQRHLELVQNPSATPLTPPEPPAAPEPSPSTPPPPPPPPPPTVILDINRNPIIVPDHIRKPDAPPPPPPPKRAPLPERFRHIFPDLFPKDALPMEEKSQPSPDTDDDTNQP